MGAITDKDENALEALYQRHGETLRSIIESVIHEQAEAEDVLQETLLQIWKQAQNYAPRVGKPLGWLTTITRRRAIDRLRRRQAYIRVKDRFAPGITSGATHRLNERTFRTQKTHLIRIEDRHE